MKLKGVLSHPHKGLNFQRYTKKKRKRWVEKNKTKKRKISNTIARRLVKKNIPARPQFQSPTNRPTNQPD